MTWMSYLPNMHGKSILKGLIFSPAVKRDIMDVPLFKQFVLWRGKRRLVESEDHLQTNRIASAFKVTTAKLVIPFTAFLSVIHRQRFNR